MTEAPLDPKGDDRYALYGRLYNPNHWCTPGCNPDNCHKAARHLFAAIENPAPVEEDPDG